MYINQFNPVVFNRSSFLPAEFLSVNFQSRIFHPCYVVRHFPVLQIQRSHFCFHCSFNPCTTHLLLDQWMSVWQCSTAVCVVFRCSSPTSCSGIKIMSMGIWFVCTHTNQNCCFSSLTLRRIDHTTFIRRARSVASILTWLAKFRCVLRVSTCYSTCYGNSVCPSVRLSHVYIVSKRLNISSEFFRNSFPIW